MPKIGRKASDPTPKEGQAGPVRPAWPPSAFTPRSWLVHACCVRCGARESELRNIAPEARTDAEQTEEYLASVCGSCWSLIEAHAAAEALSVEDSFWEAPRHEPALEELGRLPDGLPWSHDQARRMEAWRATRPKAQSLRPWPNRTVLIYLEPPTHQEQPCSQSSPRPTLPTSSDCSFPPF